MAKNSGPAYAIVGRGVWPAKIAAILEGEGRRVAPLANARRGRLETDEEYGARLQTAFVESGAQTVWLCVPPGAHVPAMLRAAVAAGVHAIAEKPWLVPRDETAELTALAKRGGIVVGVDFEYCLLDEIERWRERFGGGRGLRFGGRFAISRRDRLKIPAIVNLGCHLLAMRRYAAAEAEIGEIACAYESGDERRAWLERDREIVEAIDFTENRQPVIQRFVRRFEEATDGGAFPFGLEFARNVSEDGATGVAPQTVEFPMR